MAWIEATEENVDELFEGIMITVEEPFIGPRRKPAWECRICGFKIGDKSTDGLPPGHDCPREGREQRARRDAMRVQTGQKKEE